MDDILEESTLQALQTLQSSYHTGTDQIIASNNREATNAQQSLKNIADINGYSFDPAESNPINDNDDTDGEEDGENNGSPRN